jgi:hypothetical protein
VGAGLIGGVAGAGVVGGGVAVVASAPGLEGLKLDGCDPERDRGRAGGTGGLLAQAAQVVFELLVVGDVAGCIGTDNGLSPSLTLGCGTYGNTSTTDNTPYTHLLNVKRLIQPTPKLTPPGREPSTSPRTQLAGEPLH